MTKLSPMHIHWAFVYHACPDPVGELGQEHFHSPAGREVFAWLQDEGLVSAVEGKLRSTDRLAAWLDHLCAQPLPVSKWVQPEPE